VVEAGARAPVRLPEKELRIKTLDLTVNHSAAELIVPPTIDSTTASGHDSSMRTSRRYGMRERPINPTVYPPWRTTRGTRGLLSIRTTCGYGFCVRSIQYSRMANLRAAATFATAFGLAWQRC
jgi:hypothetical protein